MDHDKRWFSILKLSAAALPFSAGVMFVGGAASPARGDLILQVLDSSAVSGGSGSFDVVFEETNGGTDAITSHTVELSILSSAGITFTGANTNTDAIAEPYIYGSLQNPPFTTASFPNTQFDASDTFVNAPFQAVLNDGDVAGAAHITYAVASGTPGEVVPVTLGADTAVSDIDGVPIPFTIVNGTITVTGVASGHSILSLTSTAPAAYGNQITSGSSAPDKGTFTGPGAASNKMTVTGNHGSYTVAQVTGIGTSGNGDATNYVETNGFNPSNDKELFALDVKVAGVQANAAQLSTLITEIDTFSGGLASGLSVSSTLSNNPFASNYNLFLTANPGIAADDFLGFDVSHSNDSNLTGYTVSAVAVVPEPVTLGLVAAGGLGLLARRNRKFRIV
jgi:hypothetical protein